MSEYNIKGNIKINFDIPENLENIESGDSINVIVGKMIKRMDDKHDCYIKDNDGKSDTFENVITAIQYNSTEECVNFVFS